MEKREKPTIELYMYSMNQEFPVGKGHVTFLERHSEVRKDISKGLICREAVATNTFKHKLDEIAGDWSAQWIHNQWVQDYTKSPSYSSHMRPGEEMMSKLILREEEFGGLVLDPVNDRVYKVNKAGYRLLEEMQKVPSAKMATFKSKTYSEGDIEAFVSFLKGAGLWMIA
ncbi:hypothetical protein EH221_04500 [bacterium]|nr:MAG: hypothetical protein EH221_04500 [bacterium]